MTKVHYAGKDINLETMTLGDTVVDGDTNKEIPDAVIINKGYALRSTAYPSIITIKRKVFGTEHEVTISIDELKAIVQKFS